MTVLGRLIGSRPSVPGRTRAFRWPN